MKGLWKWKNQKKMRTGRRPTVRQSAAGSSWPNGKTVKGTMYAIWVRNREICYPGYETARENWVADTAWPVTKPHELPLSGLCVRSAALRMVQEESSQHELVERCEAKRMVESGDGAWFCRLLRVYVRVKHFRRCFAKPDIWSSQRKAVLLSSSFGKIG